MPTRTMTPAGYYAAVRKLHAAYAALDAAFKTAEYFDAEVIGAALSAMQRVPDRLRVQVCKQCGPTGYHAKPDDPYTFVKCAHDAVPRFDVRTGDEI